MNKYHDIKNKLQSQGVIFDTGLTRQEIETVEQRYGIQLPYELRQLFSIGLPVSSGFYNWRSSSEENVLSIINALNMPLKGLVSDLDDGYLWRDAWGAKPDEPRKANEIFMRYFANAPKMIPVYLHRYVPFVGHDAIVPVFSIMQSDIIYYGVNLVSYLETEFGFREFEDLPLSDYQNVDFWSDLL